MNDRSKWIPKGRIPHPYAKEHTLILSLFPLEIFKSPSLSSTSNSFILVNLLVLITL